MEIAAANLRAANHGDVAVQEQMRADKAVLMASFARMDVVALAVAMGAVCALGLFLLTATLLLKGAPSGQHIGTHLGLLGVYLPGYSVSWGGGVVGALYGGITGAIIGFVWATLWNLSHFLYIALVLIRAHWWRLLDD
jgi:hypothetical protein